MPNKGQTTKGFIEIADIRDGVVILKDGSLRSVIEATSINFELKSADEQTAIIRGFQDFLNSIDFPLQICVNSRKLDIEPYIKSLGSLQENMKSELLKMQIAEYSRFIKGLTELTNIMAKRFFIVIPFYAVEAPKSKKGFKDTITSLFQPGKFIKELSETDLENYKIQLEQRIEIIAEGISGLGIGTKVLERDELIKLFYSYYNPGDVNIPGQAPSN
jgi:type IV secretory pathway VirB4 component